MKFFQILPTFFASALSLDANADINLAFHGPDYIELVPESDNVTKSPVLLISTSHEEEKIPLDALLPHKDAAQLALTTHIEPIITQHTIIKKLSTLPVYFGAFETSTNTLATFYYSDLDRRALPTVPRTYPIHSINAAQTTDLLTGTLTASFDQAQPTLAGHLSNGKLSAQINCTIDKNGNFSGKVKLYTPALNKPYRASGTIHGHIGDTKDLSLLVGLARFHDDKSSSYNFAFGGLNCIRSH